MTNRTVLLFIFLYVGSLWSAPQLSNISARHVNGQTYITWNEKDLAPDMYVGVYESSLPITEENIAKALLVCGDLMPGTSCEFSQLDTAEYKRYTPLPQNIMGTFVPWGSDVDPETEEVIPDRLKPYNGLFVRTPTESRQAFYAVIVRDKAGNRITKPIAGESALEQAVAEKVCSALTPIQVVGRSFAKSNKDKRTHLNVCFGGTSAAGALKTMLKKRIPVYHYVVYGTKEHGWREGIPFNFTIEQVGTGENLFYKMRVDSSEFSFMGAYDRGGCFYGVNDKIIYPDRLTDGTVSPQSEQIVLAMLEWVKNSYPVDPDLVWASASSTAANGVFMLLLRHPGPFCAADLGTVAPEFRLLYPYESISSVMWGPTDKVMTSEGMVLDKVIDITGYMKEYNCLLPPTLLSNGRNDGWRPWKMCPPFYSILEDQAQPCWVFWDNEGHGNKTRRKTFKDPYSLKIWEVFPRNKAFLGFANGSANNDYGDGKKESGDLVGCLNAYYWWEIVSDSLDEFAADYWYDRDGKTDGGTVDVVAQRIRKFPHRAESVVSFRISDGEKTVREGTCTADRFGRFIVKSAPCDKRYRLTLNTE